MELTSILSFAVAALIIGVAAYWSRRENKRIEAEQADQQASRAGGPGGPTGPV